MACAGGRPRNGWRSGEFKAARRAGRRGRSGRSRENGAHFRCIFATIDHQLFRQTASATGLRPRNTESRKTRNWGRKPVSDAAFTRKPLRKSRDLGGASSGFVNRVSSGSQNAPAPVPHASSRPILAKISLYFCNKWPSAFHGEAHRQRGLRSKYRKVEKEQTALVSPLWTPLSTKSCL